MRIRRPMVAAALTLLALAAASPASAEPGNGADVVNLSNCVTEDYGTFCNDLSYVQNITETPSGNRSSVVNGGSSFEFTGSGPYAGCKNSASADFNSHVLIKDGTLHEQGKRSGGEFSGECFGYSYNCTYKVHYHYANGEVQFDRPEFECTRP